MMTLALAAAMEVSLLAAGSDPFTEAYTRSLQSGRPLVVLLGATWCPSCRVMKTTTLPEVARQGGLQGVEYVYVDVDAKPQVAAKLLEGRAIPQLVRLDRAPEGWQVRRLVGARTAEQIAAFVAPPDNSRLHFSGYERRSTRAVEETRSSTAR